MAAKPASRWNFLQQAVASVESKLDTILGEEENAPKKPVSTAPVKEDVGPKRDSSDISRSGTPSNDRLQERLARAMAKKTASNSETTTSTPEPLSRTSLSASESVLVLQSSEQAPGRPAGERASTDLVRPTGLFEGSKQGNEDLQPPSVNDGHVLVPSDPPPPARADTPHASFEDGRKDTTGFHHEQPTASINGISGAAHVTSNGTSNGPEEESTTTAGRAQEEINGYIERIDALQAKLKYLATDAAESAKKAAAAVQAGSAERKLLEKDEKIALLLEEGQALSKKEMNHLTTIRKLRAQIQTFSKEQADIRARNEKAEKALADIEDRARRAESAAKRTEEKLASSREASRDYDAIINERNALTATLADIKAQLSRANTRAEAAESKAQAEMVEKEKKHTEQLRAELTRSKQVQESNEAKLRKEISDLRAMLEREKETSKAMETEMLGEQAALESKLESFRTRAEESSSSNLGDSQAKLLRQIDTLQSQYSAATQNWQGIESTLLTKITSLEKERDEVTRRETDLRKRLREATQKVKAKEREVEETHGRFAEVDRRQNEWQVELQKSLRRVQQLEDDLGRARQDLEDQQAQFDRDLVRRIDEEKSKWVSALPARNESPVASLRKCSGFDFGHLMSPTHLDRGHSRRSSILPALESHTPPRQQSTTSSRALSNGIVADTPSIVTTMEPDEYFNHVPHTPASTHAHSGRGMQDLISTSTVGAGPSVQLVERMSANVRRLESEKAALKDELSRLSTQRDEARQEMVKLMSEVESKRSVEQRLKTLEAEHDDLRQRHETTLELLGEKSELVDELKADILDVKQMYRQLADTMK